MPRDWRDDRIEQLERELAEKDEIIAQQAARIAELEKRVTQLEQSLREYKELLSRNSQNSSKPPSKDERKYPKRKAKSGRKRGGQPGHPKHQRPMVPSEQVDEVVSEMPKCCDHCHGPLEARDAEPERHQVFEIPPVRPHVTEYQLHRGWCRSCRHWTKAKLPAGVGRSAFGTSVVALIGVLMGRCRLSKRAAVDAMNSMFHLSMSTGAVVDCQNRLSEALAAPVAEAYEHVQQQEVKNADETSWRECCERAWLWTAISGLVAVFMIQARRSAQAATNLLGEAQGILGTDRFSGYLHWPTRLHQMCWAHLKRDFTAISERKGEAGRIGKALLEQEKLLFTLWHRVRDGTLSRSSFQSHVRPIRAQVLSLLIQGLRCSHGKTSRTCNKMLSVFDAFWTFVRVAGVEPTNNESERTLRHAVIYRHICLGTQSEAGSRFVERILTVEASLRRQQRDMLQFLNDACQAALLNSAPPSLIPTQHTATSMLAAA